MNILANEIGDKYKFNLLQQQQQITQQQIQPPLQQTLIDVKEYKSGPRNSHVIGERRLDPIVKTNVIVNERGSHIPGSRVVTNN